MNFYTLKTCDTCRKAQKELTAAGKEFTSFDVRADCISAEKLKAWINKVEWQKLLNTRSTTWRGLDDADKSDMSEEKAVALMAAHPTLIKRPIIEKDDAVYVGWTPATKAAVL
ncbi:MAG: Spx/MgsR family RNA polymerase-binding regulatory protein [Acidimicrobiales bacterium]|nr:Spx/MgsR family RNA polymerase-binding regulatory protein [Hyphomonadaceae bacterium]RZV45097.1 MAG: Spx/MgsR family RNA polymerase-binding regulatory protein [Acidimicrobiales bacterium]